MWRRGATLTAVVLAGVEALVGWLLDHADVPGTDLSDPDSGSEEGSEEELLEDLDDTAYALVSAHPPPTHPCARLSWLWPPPGALWSAGHTGTPRPQGLLYSGSTDLPPHLGCRSRRRLL